ncbi:hypothetical protein SAMN04488120_10885 [Fontimonas thermophila]|uniref:Beta/Gamma crystallin n=1 Tax=Fontimonas thermophila TaxID=1076937 RepID=A0A1I2JKG5_9GAMM|nr:hypothetical protein [Fontimonas thermophila]SFF55342.1 hypothetical protein SAMN04488120_10885 [Fontimonas thermophila]
MRTAVAICLTLSLGLSATTTIAQEPATEVCKAYIAGEWQTLGSGSLDACLKGLEQWVSDYNEQGFKFSLWGQTLLSADRYYFYQSPDGGRSWQTIGLKSELARRLDAAAALPGPGAGDVVAAIRRDADGAATDMTPAAVSASPAQTPRPAASDRRVCSVRQGKDWKRIPNLTLEECAVELDRSPDDYDSNGFKYAYWSGVFLAANRQDVFKSAGTDNWQRVFQRIPR